MISGRKSGHLEPCGSEKRLVVVPDDVARGAVVVRLHGQFVAGLQREHSGRERAVERRHANSVSPLPQLTTPE